MPFNTARQRAVALQPKLGACVKYDLLKTVGAEPSIQLGLVKRLKFPHLADVAVLYRVILFVKAGKSTVTVYDDTLLLSKSRTQFWINFVAPSSDEGPLELREQELAKLVVSRVRA